MFIYINIYIYKMTRFGRLFLFYLFVCLFVCLFCKRIHTDTNNQPDFVDEMSP